MTYFGDFSTALEVRRSCLIYSFMDIFAIEVFSVELESDGIHINHLKFMTFKNFLFYFKNMEPCMKGGLLDMQVPTQMFNLQNERSVYKS